MFYNIVVLFVQMVVFWRFKVNKSDRDIIEDLIQTIERNAVDNKATISNVELWAKSWREELNGTLIGNNDYHIIYWKKLDSAFYWFIFGQVLIAIGFLLKLFGY